MARQSSFRGETGLKLGRLHWEVDCDQAGVAGKHANFAQWAEKLGTLHGARSLALTIAWSPTVFIAPHTKLGTRNGEFKPGLDLGWTVQGSGNALDRLKPKALEHHG